MGIQLDEHAYQKLIDENIEALNKYMPEHSLEKKHTIEVLKWSVQQIYHRALAKPSNDAKALPIPGVRNAVCGKCLYYLTCKNVNRDKQRCELYEDEP